MILLEKVLDERKRQKQSNYISKLSKEENKAFIKADDTYFLPFSLANRTFKVL
ncbi:hypothetical protein cco65_09317 [Campylobacter coli 1957]|nr:hypothetical protein cco65_09317 [Campylobacter coli 1957]